jgi:hypothetical protein
MDPILIIATTAAELLLLLVSLLCEFLLDVCPVTLSRCVAVGFATLTALAAHRHVLSVGCDSPDSQVDSQMLAAFGLS